MKKRLFIIYLLLQVNLLFGQTMEPCFNDSIPINPNSNKCIATEIHIFNELMKTTSFGDSIRYEFEGQNISYYFNDQILTDWHYPDTKLNTEFVLLENENRLLINHVTVSEHYNQTESNNLTSYFKAYIPINKNQWKVVTYLNQFRRQVIICSYLTEFMKDKEEKMYQCDGRLMYERYFQLIDSNHVSESYSLISEPRMSIVQKIFHSKYSQACGIWRYYKEDGSLKEEKTYDNCK